MSLSHYKTGHKRASRPETKRYHNPASKHPANTDARRIRLKLSHNKPETSSEPGLGSQAQPATNNITI